MDLTSRFISAKAAAKYASLSEMTIRRMLSDGRLHACRPSGTDRVLVDVRDLERVVRWESAQAAS